MDFVLTNYPDVNAERLQEFDGVNSLPEKESLEQTLPLDRYLSARNTCLDVEKCDDLAARGVQDQVRRWIAEAGMLDRPQNYSDYDYETVSSRVNGLVAYLQENHSGLVALEELETSELFVEAAFSTYCAEGALSSDSRKGGSFAFVVPARMSRSNIDYGEEVEPAIPVFRYVPKELRAQMMIGVPPFVIDTYDKDERGREGYLVFSPIFPDMLDDLDPMQALEIAKQHIDDAVDFSHDRFCVKSVGLGAILPAITRFGKDVSNKEVVVTTGHGGTAHLVKESVREAVTRGYINPEAANNIGILGLGSIGSSIAELVAEEYPETNLRLYDSNTRKIDRTANNLHGIIEALQSESEAELIKESSIVISAITSRLELRKLGVTDLSETMIIDDSQPGSFDPSEVQGLGGKMTWVIGRDNSGRIKRGHYDYGTMVDPRSDLFGCEAEAAVIADYYQNLLDRGFTHLEAKNIASKVAVQEPVVPYKARLIGSMMQRAGIGVSDFQALGKKV